MGSQQNKAVDAPYYPQYQGVQSEYSAAHLSTPSFTAWISSIWSKKLSTSTYSLSWLRSRPTNPPRYYSQGERTSPTGPASQPHLYPSYEKGEGLESSTYLPSTTRSIVDGRVYSDPTLGMNVQTTADFNEEVNVRAYQ